MVRTGIPRNSNQSIMYQVPANGNGRIPDLESDDGLKWEEFFGTSVDISSTLLDMFDTLAAKNGVNAERSKVEGPFYPLIMGPSSSDDPGGTGTAEIDRQHTLLVREREVVQENRRPIRGYNNRMGRSYCEAAFQEKKRPLSTSSVSSSSSSSSSSLPRNGLEVKRSYLASIESLDDDIVSEDSSPVRTTGSKDGANGHVQGSTSISKLRWCDSNLSHVDRVVLEIVETERTYVRDLNEIIQGYLKHISNAHHSKVSYESLDELFSNIEDIHNFNSYVVRELEDCGLDPVAVARCFVKNSDGFEVYTQYCTNYPRTVSVLTELMGNVETAEIFKERQMALQHNLPLGSYLLKPVQRILKYHLLLQNLVKHCDKDLEGYLDIKNALSVMTGIAYHINDMKRKHEHAVRVQEIQSLLYGWEGEDLTTYGELVAEGAFRVYSAKALRHLFLFDKMLLIAKKKEEGILSYKTHIMCSNLMLIESIQGEPLCFHVIPFDNPRHQYTFQARNVDQKREWCLQLKQVILENYNAVIPSHARQLVMQLGQSKQEDSVPLEKSTTRKQLSAPEYLEKRKQERRKSEINANRASSKSKKGLKKNEVVQNGKSYFAGRRKSPMETKSNDNISISSRESWASQSDNFSWTKSQNDVNNSSNHRTRSFSSSKESVSECHSSSGTASFSRDCKLRHSLPEPSLSHRPVYKSFRFRHTWRASSSVPEETTDTENDEVSDSVDVKRILALRPSSRSFRNRTLRENGDPSGEYVTFFSAHKYACRNLPIDSIDYTAVESEPDSQVCREELEDDHLTASNPSLCKRGNPRKQKNQCKLKRSNNKDACDDITGSASRKPKVASTKDNDSESASSGYSWKQSAAIRRVQSFTGMAKAKVANFHHNFSFRNHSEPKNVLKHPSELSTEGPFLPSNMQHISPTTPAAWLQNQEEHLANSDKKSGSLPRSFQLSTETTDSSTSESNLHCSVKSDNSHRLRIRIEGQRYGHSDQRPFTIASDKPSQADFLEGVQDYVDQFPSQASDKSFLSHKDSFELDTTTGCTNTPAVSMENIHFIHPEHKIYHQAASKYSTLKHVISNMGSKIAGLKATLSNPHTQEHADSCSNISVNSDYMRSNTGQSSSQISLHSSNELSPRMFTTKLAHSVAKAYSSVVKHKLKKVDSKCGKKFFETGKKEKSPIYKSESSVIGARMARPLESEYGVPKNILNNLKRRMEIETSESRNHATSSDKSKQENSFKHDEGEDTVSDASESSADSYYERTFDAIENALAEDMFRDSAIYSDPEDADFSAVESPLAIIGQRNNVKNNNYLARFRYGNDHKVSAKSPHLELSCKKGVNQVIIQRLKFLEENIKYQSESVSPLENAKTISQHKLVTDKWGLGDYEESETSSEHSASTVGTVMELGNNVSKSLVNLNKTRSQPRIKGWVKHVVDKLQGENHV